MKLTLTREDRLAIAKVLRRMPVMHGLLVFFGMLGICHVINDVAFYGFGWPKWTPGKFYGFCLGYSIFLVAIHRWSFKRMLAEKGRPNRRTEEEIVRQADEILRRAREDEGRAL